MRTFVPRLIHSLNRMIYHRFNQSWSDIRPGRIRYMLIFALAPLFANLQNQIFRTPFDLFGLDAMTWMGASYCVGAGVLFALTSVGNMHRFARLFSSLSLLFFTLWQVWADPHAAHYLAFAFAFFFGGCAAVAAYYYTYALNRSERFLGAAVTIAFAIFAQFVLSIFVSLRDYSFVYMLGLVLVTVACMFQTRPQDVEIPAAAEPPRPERGRQVGFILYFFFAHKAVEIFYTYTQDASSWEALKMNGLTGFFFLVLCLFLFFRSKYSLWQMCNLFFLFLLLANLFELAWFGGVGRRLSQILHGAELIGFIASYALLGSIMYHYADFRLFRRVLIIALNASFFIYIIPGVFAAYFPGLMLQASAAISLLFFLIFLLITPPYAVGFPAIKRLPTDKDGTEADDSAAAPEGGAAEADDQGADLADDGRLAELLPENLAVSGLQEQYQLLIEEKSLTRREDQVISCLLQGYLYKQCASELGISAETVKFHARNAYQKLGVSGRSELFSLFLSE